MNLKTKLYYRVGSRSVMRISVDSRVKNDDHTTTMRVEIRGKKQQDREAWADDLIATLGLTIDQYTIVSFGVSWNSVLELFVTLSDEQEVLMRLKYSELFGESI